MEKAYVILAHKNAEQLYRLVNRLDDGSSSFFVHIDKKVPASPFRGLTEMDRVHMLERVKTNWAGWNLVEATLTGLRAIRAGNQHFDRICLLSGQDYPIKSNRFIDNYYEMSLHRVFMEFYPLPNYSKWKKDGGLYRIEKYFFGLKWHQRYVCKVVNLLALLLPFLRRKLPGNIRPYGGSQWWTIDMYALNHILEFVDTNPGYVDFCKFSFAPDELFFQTILLNSKDEKLLKSILNNNKRFMNWDDPTVSHPEILLKSDFTTLLKSDALFARKFDAAIDAEILEMVDAHDRLVEQYG